jgi:hypothetical protein
MHPARPVLTGHHATALGSGPRAQAKAMDAHHHHLLSYLAAALFHAFALAPLAAGDPVGQFCGSVNYTANGTYQNNIERLALSLPKNISSSRALFATANLGVMPDVVYALALCRGDAKASACADCVEAAFADAHQLCANSKDATVFYDHCVLRYSNLNILDSTNGGGDQLFILVPMPSRNVTTSGGKQYVSVTGVLDNGENAVILMSTNNVTAPFNVFDNAVAVLVNATANYAAADSSKRFGTGVEAFSDFVSIYGLAQCTPNMTPADCRSCLSGIIQSRRKYLSGKQGGRILGLRCNYRYEVYPFFAGTPLLQLPEPAIGTPAPAPVNGTPPTPTTGGRGDFAD